MIMPRSTTTTISRFISFLGMIWPLKINEIAAKNAYMVLQLTLSTIYSNTILIAIATTLNSVASAKLIHLMKLASFETSMSRYSEYPKR